MVGARGGGWRVAGGRDLGFGKCSDCVFLSLCMVGRDLIVSMDAEVAIR